MNKKRGFTLAELLVGMAILVALMVMMIGIINPIALIGKGRDSRRKSDLNKIKIAFEEYFNDKGNYPSTYDLSVWNVSSNCGREVTAMSKYLKTWPCSPDGRVYNMDLGDNWFKAVTNLENKKDGDIPAGWYEEGTYPGSGFDKNAVNYGVSSTNILWYEGQGLCDVNVCLLGNCNAPQNGSCNESNNGGFGCVLRSLRPGYSCPDPACRVRCCGPGCNE